MPAAALVDTAALSAMSAPALPAAGAAAALVVAALVVAAVLMGVFGSSNGLFGLLFSWFPVSTTGSVYSFGYTLLIGVITNFIMGVWASRLMLRSISRLKIFRKPWFYGGERA